MKIAVTYENGQVFQHFGHCPQFKMYQVEDHAIVSSQVVDTAESGHDAVAGFLAANGVQVVICGGIGDGAQAALEAAGIGLVSGADGIADEVVKLYIDGQLTSAGVNCDHHSEEGCGGSCGSCGGCGGGCGSAPTIIYEGVNAGKKVKVHYEGTLDNGEVFDSSYDRKKPMNFICGVGMMIKGFDKAVVDMEVGQIVNIHLEPEDAYGMPDPAAVFTIDVSQMPGAENLKVGEGVYLQDNMGQAVPVTVVAKEGNNVTFDANHDMAGKALNFKIELLEVED